MTRPLALVSLILAMILALAAPAVAFMPDAPSDPTLAPAMGQSCPPGLRWSYRLNTCISDDPPGASGSQPLVLPGQGAPPPPEGCPPGLRWSRREARCVQPSSWGVDCGAYHRWSGRWQRCVPLCPPGTYYHPQVGDCSPQGQPVDPEYGD